MEDDPDLLLMSAIARERETPQEDIFHALLSFHQKNTEKTTDSDTDRHIATSEKRTTAMLSLQRDQEKIQRRREKSYERGVWKMETMLESLEERKTWLENAWKEIEWTELRQQLSSYASNESTAGLDDRNINLIQDLAKVSDMSALSNLKQRFLAPLEQHRNVANLYPFRPCLRTKKTWRCAESMKKGSAGILVKPHISPLSGDSSLPVPGTWFKKATLAVHYIPMITFVQLPRKRSSECESYRYFTILLIENPMDEWIQLVLQHRSENGGNAEVILDDTPMYIGPYEDPTIADAFSNENTITTGQAQNPMIVSSGRNLVQVQLEITSQDKASLMFGFWVEIVKWDPALREQIEESRQRFPVELKATVD
ncbi:unnamed protein product [Albugo candida]|nr:unnamed protein product [Albugo candida]|eukprot:CCI39683.1 unnamed protein product [Albugo candida]